MKSKSPNKKAKRGAGDAAREERASRKLAAKKRPASSEEEGPRPAKARRIKVEVRVAPRERGKTRLVICRAGKKEYRDEVNVNSAKERKAYVKALAENLAVPVEAVAHVHDWIIQEADAADAKVEQAAAKGDAKGRPNRTKKGAVDQSAHILENTPEDILEAARTFLENPDMMGELAQDLESLGIAGEALLGRTIYVIGTSRLLPQPLAGCIMAAPSSGKSHVKDKVVGCMPPEHVIMATDMTQSSLYYMPSGSLKHKLVVVAERKHSDVRDEAASANATMALREMLSSGRLDKYVPLRVGEGGVFGTVHIHQEGPIAYLETTTVEQVFEEDATRMLSLTTDESPFQTVAVMRMQAREGAGKSISPEDTEWIRQVHQTAQRMLKPLEVRTLFAEMLQLPASNVVARRAFPQLLGCIKAVALLRQYQKKIVDGRIDATDVDYEIAYELMLPILRRTFSPLSHRALKLYQAIGPETRMGQVFDRTQCQKWTGLGATEVRNRLKELVEAGLVDQIAGSKGVPYKYKLVRRGHPIRQPALKGLMTPDAFRAKLREWGARRER